MAERVEMNGHVKYCKLCQVSNCVCVCVLYTLLRWETCILVNASKILVNATALGEQS